MSAVTRRRSSPAHPAELDGLAADGRAQVFLSAVMAIQPKGVRAWQ
jgi:hypothetical protein